MPVGGRQLRERIASECRDGVQDQPAASATAEGDHQIGTRVLSFRNSVATAFREALCADQADQGKKPRGRGAGEKGSFLEPSATARGGWGVSRSLISWLLCDTFAPSAGDRR